MDNRYLLIGSAALAIAAAGAAAPVKPPSEIAQARPAEVLLASAEQQMRTPDPSAQPQISTPAKRPRAARVTTCRCAGQPPAPEQSDQ